MRNELLIFLTIMILLCSCEKTNIPAEYPTTYHKLTESVLDQKQTDYINRNQYIRSSINGFGFCDFSGDPMSTEAPPFIGEISESQATDIILEFVSKNSAETGINDPDELDFYSSSDDKGYDGSDLWHFRSENQIIDTIEVLQSSILFHLVNGKVTSCYGNWYPYIYIPCEFIYNPSKAKLVLIGKVVSHYTIAGKEYTYTVSGNNLEKSICHLKILPKEYEDIIELRVCWQIYVPDVFYILYVDVINGEIVGQAPTIIS
jgi:hypothetical protein